MNKVVLFLHGYGSNGKDLINLKDHIKINDSSVLFISPNAPERCPVNYFGYQWFELSERTTVEFQHGLSRSYFYLDNIINKIIKDHKVRYKDIVLVGFSQGAMLASYFALKSKNKLAGIISLSGGLTKKILSEITDINYNQNFSIFHGKSDTVVPFQNSEELKNLLTSNKNNCNFILEEGCDHGISSKAIDEINEKIILWLS